MTNALTAGEVNFLVFRYLQESGFTHSAFNFGHEAGLHNSPIDGNLVPPGALITCIQKGLQFCEMEANLNNTDKAVDEDFSFLQPLDLLTKDVSELRRMVIEKRKSEQKSTEKDLVKGYGREAGVAIERTKQDREKECEKDRERIAKVKHRGKRHEDDTGKELITHKKCETKVKNTESGISGGTESMDISTTSTPQTCGIPSFDVTILEGHTSEVSACAWSPAGPLLASGSGDSTARIWRVTDKKTRSGIHISPSNVLVLKHVKSEMNEKGSEVTTLDWNWEGTLLATGSYDGQARIWNRNGELRGTFSKHTGPIFSIKWNKKGDRLLTGGCDNTAIVWDVKNNEWKQQFGFHSGPTLDVDWRNNNSFATSSKDHMIYVCKIGKTCPIKTFSGHKGEVNCVKWDPAGSLLASCSDDITAKIWNMKQDKHIHDLREHAKGIYTIRWSPTGPGTNNPNQMLVLASASRDSTVKLWDVEMGITLRSLNGHRDAVYALAFSPNGKYLASGSLDKCVRVWSVEVGKIVKTYNVNGIVFEVSWNKEGDKIAACCSNNTVCVIDFRM